MDLEKNAEISFFEMERFFIEIGKNLRYQIRLVLIGSSVGMLHGQPSRMTEDIDVWFPASQIDNSDMKAACELAGLLFDPKGDTNGRPYIQMVHPGIVVIGDYKKEHEIHVSRYGNLEIAHPPVENVIASKLVRAEERDIADIMFLIKKFDINHKNIRHVIETFSEAKREVALENMIYLSAMEEVWSEKKAPGVR